MKSINQ